MTNKPSYLKLVSSQDATIQPASISVIASITEIEIIVPWYLRAVSAFISNPYLLTVQDFPEEYTHPLKIQTWTKQCNSLEELRSHLIWERQRAYPKGKLTVVDYTYKLGSLVLEFN